MSSNTRPISSRHSSEIASQPTGSADVLPVAAEIAKWAAAVAHVGWVHGTLDRNGNATAPVFVTSNNYATVQNSYSITFKVFVYADRTFMVEVRCGTVHSEHLSIAAISHLRVRFPCLDKIDTPADLHQVKTLLNDAGFCAGVQPTKLLDNPARICTEHCGTWHV
jgi:hypothetical protein